MLSGARGPIIALSLGLPTLFACTRAAANTNRPHEIRVGSKRFTESYILAEIAVATMKRASVPASHEQGLGGTALVFRALQEGSIDVYPEYTGTIAEAVLHVPNRDIPSLRGALEPLGVGMTDALGFDDTYAIAVSGAVAAKRHLASLSDVAKSGGVRFGFSPEFMERTDGFRGLSPRYGLPISWAQEIDHGLAYEALARGAIEGTDVYSTDAAIARYGLTVLADDKGFFPAYQAVFLYRADIAQKNPSALAALKTLEDTIDVRTMTSLNAKAEIDRQTFASVADAFVRSRTGGDVRLPERRRSLLSGIVATVRAEGPRHANLVVLALALAVSAGVPLGIVASEARVIGAIVLGATSLVQTVPALALLCFLIPFLGTGQPPALTALFVYALLPIARNTLAGLDGISPSLRESASALGLSWSSRLIRIDLPLASPLILAGIRTSAVISVGTATLAAFIGAGGFGAPISAGLNLNDTDLILEGAISAALFAILVELAFSMVSRIWIPKGLRLTPTRQGRA